MSHKSPGLRSATNLIITDYVSAPLCYGSLSLFTTMLHNVFLIYHIEMFVSVFKIDKSSFWIGESIFLVWNAVNDPLFGWLGERHSLNSSKNTNGYQEHDELADNIEAASHHLVLRRTKLIAISGPLLALSFLTLWFNWHSPLIQFTSCLCAYDAFLTMVDLQQSALLAELSITTEGRAHMNSYESAFSAIGCISVFISYSLWDKRHIGCFQLLCILLALFAAIGFYVMAYLLRHSYMSTLSPHQRKLVQSAPAQDSHSHNPSRLTLRLCVKQLMTRRNFLAFALINIIQVFHCHFNSNFFPLFMEALVSDHKHYGPFLIGMSFVVPHVNNIIFLRLCNHYGVYNIIRFLFSLKLCLSLVMLSFGMSHGWLMCLFIVSNRVCTEGTCKLLTLVITDLVDEDYVHNNRSQPISTFIFGTANFLAKPGQALAPIIGTSIISAMTGVELFSSVTTAVPSATSSEVYRHSCFLILVYVPLVCGALQLFIWSFFKLRGTHLQRIKLARSNLQYLLAV